MAAQVGPPPLESVLLISPPGRSSSKASGVSSSTAASSGGEPSCSSSQTASVLNARPKAQHFELFTVIGGNFEVGEMIGKGSHGTVFSGVDLQTRAPVALKCEPMNNKRPRLQTEAGIMQSLAGVPGIPPVLWHGVVDGTYVMVLPRLGASLEDLFTGLRKGSRRTRSFDLLTVARLADRLVAFLEAIHVRGVLHCDIKPGNFLVGPSGQEDTIFMIDFGLSRAACRTGKSFDSTHFEDHLPTGLVGTARYASLDTHMGVRQSPSSDLEALGYMLVAFAKGSLPWEGFRGAHSRAELHEMIFQKKRRVSIASLCRGLPAAFGRYLHYCRDDLVGSDAPDYGYLRSLWRDLLSQLDSQQDAMFEWCRSGRTAPNDSLICQFVSVFSRMRAIVKSGSALNAPPTGSIATTSASRIVPEPDGSPSIWVPPMPPDETGDAEAEALTAPLQDSQFDARVTSSPEDPWQPGATTSGLTECESKNTSQTETIRTTTISL